MSETRQTAEMEIIEDDSFSLDGFQVVRGEFFAHTYEPSITFADCKVYVNTACIKKLSEFDYIQILVNSDNKKLAVLPCSESDKDSFRWCSATAKRTPKHITCKIFFAKVFALMGWNPKDRYKLLGKLIKSHNQLLFVFDLSAPEVKIRSLRYSSVSVALSSSSIISVIYSARVYSLSASKGYILAKKSISL